MKRIYSAIICSAIAFMASCQNTGETDHQQEVKQAPETNNLNTGLTMDAYSKMVSTGKNVLVDFSATWCGPCKRLSPILESIASQRKDKMTLIKLDADDNKDLVRQKGISGIPYLELYKDGKLVWKHEGFIEEDELLKQTNL